MASSPTSFTVDASGFVVGTLTIMRTNYRGTVTPVASGLPTGVTASFVPSTLAESASQVTIRLDAASNVGLFTNDSFDTTFSGAGIQPVVHTATVTTVPAVAPAITATSNVSTNTMLAGASCQYTLTLARTNYTGVVTPSVTGLPAGVTAAFSDSALDNADTVTILTLTSAPGTTPVSLDALVVSFAGSGVTTFDLNLTVSVTSAGANPTPGVGATVILDTRAGGAQDIQAVSTWAAAHALIKAAGSTNYSQPLEPRVFDSGFGDNSFGWNFVTNQDGSGRRAFRSDMVGWGDRANSSYSKDMPGPDSGTSSTFDGGNKMTWFLPSPLPTELYISFKCWHGRTATGGGYNDIVQVGGVDRSSVVGRFAHSNEEVGTGRAGGRKWILIPRGNVGDGGCGRYDIIWYDGIPSDTAGTGTVTVVGTTATFSTSQSGLTGKLIRVPGQRHQLLDVISGSGTSWTIAAYREPTIPVTITNEAFVITDKRPLRAYTNSNVQSNVYCDVASGMPQNDNERQQNLATTSFQIIDCINQVLEYTVRVKVATTMGAADGIEQVWCNGELIMNATDINYGSYPLHRLEFLGCTFRTPRFTQTEYFWDIVIWKP